LLSFVPLRAIVALACCLYVLPEEVNARGMPIVSEPYTCVTSAIYCDRGDLVGLITCHEFDLASMF
jgi:hypothetical protein